MRTITVRLEKPGSCVSYQGELILEETGHLLVHARWDRGPLERGPLCFEPGDHFFEHYYTDRWFNIHEVRGPGGALKGWYCNLARPARVEDGIVTSEDLELDLVVSADLAQVLILDVDEFEERFAADAPPRSAALEALDELRDMARRRAPPFDSTQGLLSLARLR